MLVPVESKLIEINKAQAFPMTLAWSRLEGRPRSNKFDRALKAEVRDALWMLTKQWQMGEFAGDDAGSPVTCKISTTTAAVNKYQAGSQPVQPFDKEVPFEALVEQRPLPFSTLEQDISLDLRLVMGRRWIQLLKNKGVLAATRQFFLDHYGIQQPTPDESGATICAHAEVWQQFAAMAGRVVDGARLYADFTAATHYYDLPDFPLPGDKTTFDEIEATFTAWYKDLFYQPADPVNNAWQPQQLEYQFAIAAGTPAGEKVMHAEEYYHGHLDWYNVDINRNVPALDQLPGNPAPPPPVVNTQSMIPAPVVFDGMPNTRWWAFEDGKTNFSYITPDTTDLAKLLLVEFGLVYANDWYLIPYRLPVGSLTTIKGLTVTNSFGETFWIEAAGKGDDNDWQRWNMFSMKVDSPAPVAADTDLLLLPSVAKIQEGKPTEEIVLIRDEMANMVWAVETVVPLPSGISKRGAETAREFHGFLQKLVTDAVGPVVTPAPVTDGEEAARIRYQVMNTIPENWIPFVPAHTAGSHQEVQLQRAAMPRILEGDTAKPDKIRPRTALLQPGLKDKLPYFIQEAEVPRAGVRVTQSFQRTRWTDGRVFVWYGVRKTTGRGEGSSGLGFDRIVDRPVEK